MKKFLAIVFVVSCVVAMTLASPAKDLKELKKEAARKKACMHECSTEQYKPVCAGKTGAKPMSFGSLCVMNNYNCDNNESLAKVSEGECPGGGGVRLS